MHVKVNLCILIAHYSDLAQSFAEKRQCSSADWFCIVRQVSFRSLMTKNTAISHPFRLTTYFLTFWFLFLPL